MSEGYAGTSESGFAEEVAANEAVARMDYLEDIYRDLNDGGASIGGAAERISAEFERIRRELGDLPGVVASPARLRTMLEHLAKTLHPGVLNDCFYQASTAVCRKRAKAAGWPLLLYNMCLICPNARRSTIHVPWLRTARDQALSALDMQKKDRKALPRLQVIDGLHRGTRRPARRSAGRTTRGRPAHRVNEEADLRIRQAFDRLRHGGRR
ncbi:hypothetical protein AB0L85_32000 [Streptomyces sp. NPDC052051]|uniref:hypothetical protein n=1 Tax=Streptomyces sp. NPDC052051 TaxID=3154649 RepID=UPI00343B6EF1